METNTEAPAGTQAPSPTAWIDAYVAWATQRSPLTPRHFHEGIAYSLAACAIAGRLCAETPQGRVYPNLYTLLLGKTSVYAKSVAMDLSQEVAELAMIDNRIINSVFTPESIMGELSGAKPMNFDALSDELQDRWRQSHDWGARRMFRLDEAGIFFNSLKRDYNAGLTDLWMKLYDCPATVERTTYKHGLHVIQRPVLSCLFATTPASIGALLRDENMWLQGFWPRWNFCIGAGYSEFARSTRVKPSQQVTQPLFDVGNNKLGPWQPDSPLVIPVDDAVYKDYEDVLEANRHRIFENEDGFVEAALARLHAKRLKLALILTALQPIDTKDMRVTMLLWQATERTVRQMELDMNEAIRQSHNTEKARLDDRIVRFLKRNNNRASARQVRRFTGLSYAEFTPIAEGMNKGGIIRFENVDGTVFIELSRESRECPE
jgi:hypothetical protein